MLLGTAPGGVTLTRRAVTVLTELRRSYAETVAPDASVLAMPSERSGRWWTWSGTAANRTLQASLPALVDPRQRVDEKSLRLLPGITPADVRGNVADPSWSLPYVAPNAVAGLKFSAALPPGLAEKTLAVRLRDELHARDIVAMQRRVHRTEPGE